MRVYVQRSWKEGDPSHSDVCSWVTIPRSPIDLLMISGTGIFDRKQGSDNSSW